MSRKLAYWIVALLVLVTAIFANKQPAPGTNWAELTKTRRKTVYARNLVALNTFLQGQFGGMTQCSFGYLYDGFRDNVSHLSGTLLCDWKVRGRFGIDFYYDGLNPEPSSHSVHLVLQPDLVEKSRVQEWKSLLQQTLKQKEVRTTYGDIQWFSFVDKQGEIDLTLRIPSATRWYPNVPEYDRGFTDEMYFGVKGKALAYLFKEAFQDPYTRIEFEAPTFNPPTYISHRPLGIVNGFIYPKDGPPLRLAISTSSDLSYKNVSLHVQIDPVGNGTWTEDQAKAVLKPDFLAKLDRDGRGTIVTRGGTMQEKHFYVAVDGPLDAFPEPKPR